MIGINSGSPRSLRRMAVVSILTLGAAAITTGAQEARYLEIDPAKFDRSTNIDNAWWPLKPGTRLTYEGFTVDQGKKIRHRIVETVTDLTKTINGVRTLVNLEMDYSDGKVLEKEIAFHAQDNEGNVWHLGQLRETYEDGRQLVGGQSWLVGHPKEAKAGIRMLADPAVGTPAYSQGYAPAPFHWTDRARVTRAGQTIKVPAGNYKDVMVIEEWDEESPKGALQTKYYARGVGIVRIGFRGEDKSKEEVALVKIEELSPEAMAEAHAEAFGLEQRAYEYSRTPPVERVGSREAAKK
jgi:hypothetical protein